MSKRKTNAAVEWIGTTGLLAICVGLSMIYLPLGIIFLGTVAVAIAVGRYLKDNELG